MKKLLIAPCKILFIAGILILIWNFGRAFQAHTTQPVYIPVVEVVTKYVEAQTEPIEVIKYIEVDKLVYIPATTKAVEFIVTAYCSCEKCCGVWALNRPGGIVYGASGSELLPGRSIAVDRNVIPYGTKVYIEGMGEYIAEDTGGGIKGNKIDIYFTDHQSALNFGLQKLKVWILEKMQ